MAGSTTYRNFTKQEQTTALAVFNQLFPPHKHHPGAIEAGVLDYIDRIITEFNQDDLEWYRLGFKALNACSMAMVGLPFADCHSSQQTAILLQLEQGTLPNFSDIPQQPFFEMLLKHLREGLFSDPSYGGNREKSGWAFLNHPGVWHDYSEAEQLGDKPADKAGNIRTLQDLDTNSKQSSGPVYVDYQPGTTAPTQDADVVIIGLGGVGGVIAYYLTKAGLNVVALEAGPWQHENYCSADELQSFYARASYGPKV